MTLLGKFFNLGVEGQPKHLQKKIYTSNIVGLVLFFVATLYTAITALLFPPLTFLPAIGIAVVLGGLGLNAIGAHRMGRALFGLLPTGLAVSYAALLMPADQEPSINILLLSFSFTTIPVVLFDLKTERILLALISVATISIFLSFDALNAAFEYGLDDTVFRTGWMGKVTTGVSFIVIFSLLIALAATNLQSESTLDQVLSEAQSKNDQLKASEDALNNKLQELADKQELENKNRWITQGIAETGAMLRQNDLDIEELSRMVLSHIIRYLQANQGALFVINDDESNPVMVQHALYAYDRQKYQTREIHPGEGLIGTAWLEKDKIFMTEVPQDYIRIQSGLGTANPGCVLVMPLKVNDEIFGMIEIASFKALEEYQVDFVEKVGEIIASTLSSTKVNLRTARLLRETQDLGEQMRMQEEELRQNQEELMATQEEMKRTIDNLRMELEGYKQQTPQSKEGSALMV